MFLADKLGAEEIFERFLNRHIHATCNENRPLCPHGRSEQDDRQRVTAKPGRWPNTVPFSQSMRFGTFSLLK